jgi:pyruvate-formate lyase-activating enzyme
MTAYRDFLYPLNVFMHILTLEGGTAESLHYGLFESADEPLAVAQERSTMLLLERLPALPARLIEVGIGLGTLLRRLASMGYDAEGMTPDAQQFAMVRARHGDRVKASCGRFEDFANFADTGRAGTGPTDGGHTDAEAPLFDVAIFQESSQYIDSDALFGKAAAITTRVLVLDEFALQPLDAAGGLRSRAAFLSAAAAAGFHVAEEVDLSRQAAPTVDYFLSRIPRYRDALVADLDLSREQIDALVASGHRYRDCYARGIYGYRLFDLRRPATALVLDPFLQVRDGQIDNPITGRALARAGDDHDDDVRHHRNDDDDDDYAALSLLLNGGARVDEIAPARRTALARDGWLVEPHPDLARRFRLRIVTIETHTACNQSCSFCPVSIEPRDADTMPDALFQEIVRQLAAFRGTLEGVFFSGYNEPTLDPHFVERCARLLAAGLPVAVNTNATGLTPARVDKLADEGMLRLLSVNLSTLDRGRYAHDRGRDHLELVLRNLDYARDRPVADEMTIAVLGTGDAAHRDDFEAVRTRFAGSRFEVRFHEVMDRAGLLPIGLRPAESEPRALRGCENLGSRPLQHLHITAAGQCVFCCEDYDERYVVGDLRTTSILDVLRGDELARLRRWSHGMDDAPDDFTCRRCIFALRR